jgi:hypothetical protein
VAITIVTYSYVEPGGNPPTCALESVSADVESYLLAHVVRLLEGAANGSSPPARFQSADGKDRFQLLLEGSDGEFLQAAEQVAQRLHKEMDNRAKPGFFVAMRSREGQRTWATVLKLDIHAKSGAAMSRTGPGRPTFEAVKDLLDIPGQLQKGVVFRDDRGGSDIVVGDRLTETAFYFLRAIDAVQMSKPGQAISAVVNAVAKVAGPKRTVPVIRALETEQETTPEEFFARHPDLLEEHERAQVYDQLRVRRRPVDRFDARQHVLDEIVTADGITVRGRATTMADKLRVFERPGGWRIEINVDEEPQHEFH